MPAAGTALIEPQLESIIRAEFDEMPGMRLTMSQVSKFWTLAPGKAEAVIQSLVCRGALTIDRRGRVCRPDDLTR